MQTPAEIRKAVLKQLSLALGAEGFRPRRIFLLRARSAEVTDWLALGSAVPDRLGPVELYLNVGIHCAPLQRLEAELLELKYQPTTATFVVHLGYLTPERRFRCWSVPRDQDSSNVAEEMVSAIRQFAAPFWADYTTLASVEAGCLEHGMADLNALRLPVLRYLQGDVTQARALVMAELEKQSQEQHAAAIQFCRAATRLLEQFGNVGSGTGAA